MRGILLCVVLVGMYPVSASGGELRSARAALNDDSARRADGSSNRHFNWQSALLPQGSVSKEIIEIRASGAG